jgi:hypothetical protein
MAEQIAADCDTSAMLPLRPWVAAKVALSPSEGRINPRPPGPSRRISCRRAMASTCLRRSRPSALVSAEPALRIAALFRPPRAPSLSTSGITRTGAVITARSIGSSISSSEPTQERPNSLLWRGLTRYNLPPKPARVRLSKTMFPKAHARSDASTRATLFGANRGCR